MQFFVKDINLDVLCISIFQRYMFSPDGKYCARLAIFSPGFLYLAFFVVFSSIASTLMDEFHSRHSSSAVARVFFKV